MHKKSWKSLFEKIEKITILLIFAHFASSKKNPFLHFFVKIQKVRLDFPNIFPKNAQKYIYFFFLISSFGPNQKEKNFHGHISHIGEMKLKFLKKKTFLHFSGPG